MVRECHQHSSWWSYANALVRNWRTNPLQTIKGWWNFISKYNSCKHCRSLNFTSTSIVLHKYIYISALLSFTIYLSRRKTKKTLTNKQLRKSWEQRINKCTSPTIFIYIWVVGAFKAPLDCLYAKNSLNFISHSLIIVWHEKQSQQNEIPDKSRIYSFDICSLFKCKIKALWKLFRSW